MIHPPAASNAGSSIGGGGGGLVPLSPVLVSPAFVSTPSAGVAPTDPLEASYKMYKDCIGSCSCPSGRVADFQVSEINLNMTNSRNPGLRGFPETNFPSFSPSIVCDATRTAWTEFSQSKRYSIQACWNFYLISPHIFSVDEGSD